MKGIWPTRWFRCHPPDITCGNVKAYWDFYLTENAPCQGYFIQLNVLTPATLCDGKTKCLKVPAFDDGPWDGWFLEAWEVDKDKPFAQLHYTTGFTDAVILDDIDYCKGTMKTAGQTRFFCKSRTGDLAAKGWKRSGGLLTTRNFAWLWFFILFPSDATGVAKRNAWTSWCCCNPSGPCSADADPKPDNLNW